MSSENEREASISIIRRKGNILIRVLVLMLPPRPFSRWNKHSYACACACVASENQGLPFTQNFRIVAQRLAGTAESAKRPETRTKHAELDEFPFGTSNRENGTNFSEFPFVPGIFQWNEPKDRVPFKSQPEFPGSFSKWWTEPLRTYVKLIFHLRRNSFYYLLFFIPTIFTHIHDHLNMHSTRGARGKPWLL